MSTETGQAHRPYPYLWLDALVHRCREGGRIVNVATVVAVGVNGEGRREVLGMDVFTSEDGAAWLAFLRDLATRGLTGVVNVTPDAHVGLKQAIVTVFPGAMWQRCRTHFMRNLLGRVPRVHQDMVASLVRSVFGQPNAEAVRTQYSGVIDKLRETGFEVPATMLAKATERAARNRPPAESALAPGVVKQPAGASEQGNSAPD